MKDANKYNKNNQNVNDILNYKGYFVEKGINDEKKYYEFGAHFSYKELYIALMKLKAISEKKVNIPKIKPKNKINIEKNNKKDKKIEENINNIIKEFKIKTRSRNIEHQDNKILSNKNLNQLTYIPLKINENKLNIDKYNHINKNMNNNHVINNIDNRLRQLRNKYNQTRNKEQKYSFEFPAYFTENINLNNINLTNENNTTNYINNNINKNTLNNQALLFKSYQKQVNKIHEIELRNRNKYNFIKNNIISEQINDFKKKRILSYNFNNNLDRYHYGKLKFSPLKNIQTEDLPISGENYKAFKYNNKLKDSNYIPKSNIEYNTNYKLKRFKNQRDAIFRKINSISLNKKKKSISKSINIDIPHIQNNISNISNNSQNNSKNITFQNFVQGLNRPRNYYTKTMKIDLLKEGVLSNYKEAIHKNKIQNLFKLLNKHEKISRNKNMNYFLNNTSYIHYTQQNNANKMLHLNNNGKKIYLETNNILQNKNKNRVKIENHLYNSKNPIFNSINNKYFNSSYINNTNTQNNFSKNNFMNKIHTTQNNVSNNNNLNIRKKPKKNNVNINININNNNKIIYNKVYEYKSPLMKIGSLKIMLRFLGFTHYIYQ